MQNAYTNLIITLPELAALPAVMKTGAVGITGIYSVHKAHLCASLCSVLKKTAILLVPDEGSGARVCADMCAMGCTAMLYPARENAVADVHSREYEQKRIGVLTAILRGDCTAVVCTPEAAAQITQSPGQLKDACLELEVGKEYSLEQLNVRLADAGYSRCEQVEGAGQYCIRGGILDIFPPSSLLPYRIDFWGDTLDSLATFDPQTQRRNEPVDSVQIPPALEAAINKQDTADSDSPISAKYTIFDYMPKAFLCVSESFSVRESFKAARELLEKLAASELEAGAKTKAVKGLLAQQILDWDDLLSQYEKRPIVYMDTFPRGSFDTPVRELFTVNARQPAPWSGSLGVLLEDIRPLLNLPEQRVCVIALTAKAARSIAGDLAGEGIPAVFYEEIPPEFLPGTVSVLHGGLSGGLGYEGGFTLFTTTQKFADAGRRHRTKKRSAKNAFTGIEELRKGDYVVHQTHGIGIFDGVQRIEAGGAIKDYIKISYDKRDVLYLPVTQLDQVTKYIGPHSDERPVKLSRLGGTDWERSKAKARGAAKDIAEKLVEMYAKRANSKGHQFAKDDELQQDFAARFPFQETSDQLRSIHEVKVDMERPHPMDRLLCGDVGFGKTEVALRAAFKCCSEGKQCAILVPTTILALQHFRTAKSRFEGFPIDIRMLSRFVPLTEQKQTIAGLKRGNIELVIGTHRLLNRTLKFKDLGLLIVDEEQRFGTLQKELLKEKFPGVDVLTLTATPIPRTLNMAMSGVRDMSVLEDSPQDRHPVQTYVLEHHWGQLAQAMQIELRRGGQVYYLHNRVESIYTTAAKIQEMLPEARIGVGHGKMNEQDLSDVWRRLLEGDVDILVCTTIIEAGVDVPNVNTLIVEDADKFGLAQLHQIRGRVGRSSRRATAYFTFRRGKQLTEIAYRRLSAIREYTQFGSGFAIAMRDLELRGAGNILGAQQSGHVHAVGYEMYLRIIGEAVRELKGEAAPEVHEPCLIDLPVDAHIPEEYISSIPQRLGIYRRIAEIRCQEDAHDVLDELLDSFGEPPAALMGLIKIALVRAKAEHVDIYEIRKDNQRLVLYLRNIDPGAFQRLGAAFTNRVTISAKGFIALRLLPEDKPLEILECALELLAGN
ncbi:MAG: transcription-repair coupling factor [Oscillospiraceae bacterium]|nr:transcription-repair coupling factor [Oscillospiraceae bacterium]